MNADPVHQIILLDDYSNFKPPTTTVSLKKALIGPYTLWTESQVVGLLTTHFEPDVLKAYNTVKAKALKADLARYCILYVYGGWYVDLLMTIDGTIAPYSLNNYQMLVFRDLPIRDGSVLPISNSIIWVRDKENKVLKSTINRCVENILSRSYPRLAHRITGPVVFGSELARYCLEVDDPNLLVGDLTFSNETGLGEFTISNWLYRRRAHFGWYKLTGLEDQLPDEYQKGLTYESMFTSRELYTNE